MVTSPAPFISDPNILLFSDLWITSQAEQHYGQRCAPCPLCRRNDGEYGRLGSNPVPAADGVENMRSLQENMRAVMDRLQLLSESLMSVPDALYEAVDNLEDNSRGTITEGDYVL